jgi:CRP/FNR family transcriptional regulator
MAGGQELTFDVVRSGTMFGIASLMERTQDEYAAALEPSRVGVLGLSEFWHLVRQNPAINARLVKLLGDRLRMTRGRMADIALKETPARLASLILDLVQSEGVVTREGHYKIVARYTHGQLAAMIGASRVSATRAFRNLQDIGCVRLSRRQIYVVDLAVLIEAGGRSGLTTYRYFVGAGYTDQDCPKRTCSIPIRTLSLVTIRALSRYD